MNNSYKLNFGKALLITFIFFILQIIIGFIYNLFLVSFDYFNNFNLNFILNYLLNHGIIILLSNLSAVLIIIIIYNNNKSNLKININYNNLNISFLLFIIPLTLSSQIVGTEIENLISIFFKRSMGFYQFLITLANLPGISGLLLSITLIAIFPSIIEELLFRGIIQQGLVNKYSAKTGIILTSFLFTIIHINPHILLTIFFISVLLGFVYHIYKNILYNILIHFFLNLFGLLILRYDKFQINGLNTDLNTTSHVNIYLILFSLIIIGLFVYIFLIKKNKQNIKDSITE